VEHFGAAIVNVSVPLTAVMGLETALMEVMRLDAVSFLIYETVVCLIIECISTFWLHEQKYD